MHTDINSCIWISASAGTGKTFRLVQRVISLIVSGQKNILGITFTNAAATEMRDRISKKIMYFLTIPDDSLLSELNEILYEKISFKDIDKIKIYLYESITNKNLLQINTIHSFCYNIMMKFSLDHNENGAIEILEEDEIKLILIDLQYELLATIDEDHDIYEHINRVSPDFFSTYQYATNSVVNTLKQIISNPNNIKNIYNEDEKKITSYLYYQYLLYKKTHNKIDYSEIIEHVLQIFNSTEKDWVLYNLNYTIDHILIDESQDNSQSQWDIIKNITSEFFNQDKNKTIFVVGDVKQSIYSFQGAEYKLFEENKEFYKQKCINHNRAFHTIDISHSFRFNAKIVDFINLVFNSTEMKENNDFPFIKHSTAKEDDKKGIIYLHPLINITKNKEPNPWDFEEIIDQTDETADIISKKILDLINNNNTNPNEIMILSRTRTNLINNINKTLQDNNVPTYLAINVIPQDHILIKDLINIGRYYLDPNDSYMQKVVVKSSFFENEDEGLRELNKILFSTDIMKFYLPIIENYRETILARLGKDCENILNSFYEEILRYTEKNINYLPHFIRYLQEAQMKSSKSKNSNALQIMTIHASKGLEAKTVILLDTASLPKGISDSENYKEYIRLLYVALTRAKENIYIYGHTKRKTKNMDKSWYGILEKSIKSQEIT